MGVPCLMGTEFQFGMRESSGNGGRCWLHNSVKVLNATELNTSMVKMINSMLCIFFHNKKKKNQQKHPGQLLYRGSNSKETSMLP